jgi:hypothetical protein
MSFRALVLAAALIAFGVVVPAQAEGPRDVAELFPAQTLAYLEFRQPDKLAREIATLLRGSALEDLPAALARHREKRGPGGGFDFEEMMLAQFAMFVAPEAIAEFGRFQGGAVGITGFTKNMEPEIVGVMLSGTSNAPTFVVRTIITVDSGMRKLDECEGIILYRDKSPDFRKVAPGGAPAPASEFRGPILAAFRDGFIIGSTADSVKEVIRRLKGKTGDPSLSSVAAFRDAAKLREKPGLFGFADLGALNIQLEELMKNASAPAVFEWNRIKTILNPKAGRQATLGFTIQNGTIELNARLGLENGETSPLVDLLPNKKANSDALHFVPKDAGVAFAVSLPDGEKRWSKALALAEMIHKQDGGRGPSLGKQIEELEKALKLAFGKDVFAKMSDFVVVVDPLVLTASGNPLRLMVLTATDEAAAKTFEEDVLPKVAALIPPGQVKPTEETIQGQRLRSIPLEMLGPGSHLHYGRQGKTLVFGMTGELTATALASGAKKSGLLADAKTAGVLKEAGDASIVGVLPLHTLLPIIVPEETGARFRAAIAVPGGPAPPPAKPAVVSPFKLKLVKDLAKASEALPPMILALERKPEEVTLVIRQSNFKVASTKIIDAVVNASLEKLLNPSGAGGGVGLELPPPPPKE